MTQPVSNLRVKRTQKLLREALIELIEERGFEALTIGELTRRAMVSRAAFYRHYQDKYGLVEQIFEEAMNALLDNSFPCDYNLKQNSISISGRCTPSWLSSVVKG